MSKLPSKKEYDVVVIGAGIGGLVAASILSRAGLSACVLEKQAIPGGYLMGFQRNRFQFDTAIHWLNQCLPGGMTHTIFESLGTDYPKATAQKRVKRFIGDDFDFLMTNNPDDFKEVLQAKFPHERKGLERFFNMTKNIGDGILKSGHVIRTTDTMTFPEKVKNGWKVFKYILPFFKHLPYTGDKGVKKGLNRYFKDPKLHSLFASESDMMSCIIPIAWAYVGDFQNPPVGGGQSFADWLRYVVESLGNEVCYHSDVQEVLLEGNKAVGVRVKHREEEYQLKSKYVLAACDVELLYKKMLPTAQVPAELVKNLENAEMYSSSLTLSVALDCPPSELGFDEEMVFISRQDIARDEHMGGDPEKTEIIVLAPSHRDPAMAPEGKGSITIFMPAEMHQHDNWKAEKDENGEYVRGEAYQKLKSDIAEVLIRRVGEKMKVALREHVLFYEVATPITHHRYTGNKNGTMMGARPGKANYQAKIAHYKTAFENLYLSGHWAELGGGVPIAVKAGCNAALLVMQKENPKAFRLYCDYLDGKIEADKVRNSTDLKTYPNNWERLLTPAELLKIRREREHTA